MKVYSFCQKSDVEPFVILGIKMTTLSRISIETLSHGFPASSRFFHHLYIFIFALILTFMHILSFFCYIPHQIQGLVYTQDLTYI